MKKKRKLIFFSICIVLIKLSIISITSFPFDFASYVYQVRQTTDFDIHPLFYWNKGFFLQSLFFVNHYMYDVLRHIFGFYENINILHLVFKFPLLVFDIFTGYFLYKIIFFITEKEKKAFLGFLLWITNPIVFWSISIEGKYAIIATFFVTLSLYLFIRRQYVKSLIPLAFSVSIYYYAIILFPVWFIFYLSRNEYKLFSFNTVKYVSVFLLVVLVSFLNFILYPEYLPGLFGSLLHHAQPDAPMNASEVYISKYSLFNIPFYLVKKYLPTNLSAPEYFSFVSKATLIGIIGVSIFHINLFFKVIRRKIIYSDIVFVKYSLVALLIFAIFIGKFQSHYITWILPFLIVVWLLSSKIKQGALFVGYLIVSFLPIFIVLGYLNLGIFFLDSVQWGVVNLWFKSSLPITFVLGGVVMTSLIYILDTLLFSQNEYFKVQNEKHIYQKIAVILGFLFVLSFIVPICRSYSYIIKNGSSQILATDKGVLRFAFAKRDESQLLYESEKTIKHDSFLRNSDNFFNKKKWKKYVIKNGSIEETENSIILKVEGIGDMAQYNNGGNYSNLLIPIEYNSKYNIDVIVNKEIDSNAEYKTIVRFADNNRKIISGSDIVLSSKDYNHNTFDSLEFKPKNKQYKYMEVLFSLGATSVTNSKVSIRDIKIVENKIKPLRDYTFIGKSNRSLIQGEIFDNIDIRNKFNIHVFFKNISSNDIKSSMLNNCIVEEIVDKKNGVEYIYDVDCVEYDSENKLSVEYIFFPERNDVNMAVLHKNIRK